MCPVQRHTSHARLQDRMYHSEDGAYGTANTENPLKSVGPNEEDTSLFVAAVPHREDRPTQTQRIGREHQRHAQI